MKHLALFFCLAGCVTGGAGRPVADPTNRSASQPGPAGEPTYVNMGDSAGAAAVMTVIGVGASVAQRKAGGCYADCPPGTTCNRATGYCDELPCRGLCTNGQLCDTSGPLPRCVAGGTVDLKIDSRKDP